MYYEYKCALEARYISLDNTLVDGDKLDRLCEAASQIEVDNEKNKTVLEGYGISLTKPSNKDFYKINNNKDLRNLLSNVKLSTKRRLGVSRLFIEPNCKRKEFGQIHIYEAGILIDIFPDYIKSLIEDGKIYLKPQSEALDNINQNHKKSFDLELEEIEETRDYPCDRPLNEDNCYSGNEALYLSLKEAISLGSSGARYTLAKKYLNGEELHKSINKAICLLTEGALLNQLPSIELLVDLYTADEYTIPNYELANSYAKVGAALGSYFCTKKLVYNYLNGNGVRRSLNAAIYYAKMGMNLDDNKGLFEWVLANIYLNNEELNKTKEEAIELLKLASDKGLKNASVKISLMYNDDEEKFRIYASKSLKQDYYIREEYWKF